MDLRLCLLLHCPLPSGALRRTKMLMRRMQVTAPVQPWDNMMMTPSWAGTWWVRDGEACWQ